MTLDNSRIIQHAARLNLVILLVISGWGWSRHFIGWNVRIY